jgi:hypothetical protein
LKALGPHSSKRTPHDQAAFPADATFAHSARPLPPPPIPPPTNQQITLDYMAHREIFRAIIADNSEELRSTWLKWRDIEIRAEEALSLCVQLGRLNLIPLILGLGGKPDQLSSSHLERLVSQSSFYVLELFLEAGAPVNNQAGESEALGIAVKRLILQSQTLSTNRQTDWRGLRASFLTIELLLKHGARMDQTLPQVRLTFNSPSATKANTTNHILLRLCKLFNRYGAELRTDLLPETRAELASRTRPLEDAILKGDVTQVNQFLKNDPRMLASVHLPLSKAVQSASLEMVRYLVEGGCDVNEGYGAPLLYACTHFDNSPAPPNPSIVRFLLERGAGPSLRNGEAFLRACSGYANSLGTVFLETNSLPHRSRQLDAALRAILVSAWQYPDRGLYNLQDNLHPGLQILSMTKTLVESGADPYPAILYARKSHSSAALHEPLEPDRGSPSSHYKAWADFLRQQLQRPLRGDTEQVPCYLAAEAFLLKHADFTQTSRDPSWRSCLTLSLPGQYCQLMSQVLEPSSRCWINSLMPNKSRQLPASLISPQLLKADSRYKMVSDVAAITVVLHRPAIVHQKFIELAKATFSDRVKLKDSKQSNEKMVEWLPTTKRLVKHFADIVLFPALLRELQPEMVRFFTPRVLKRALKDLEFIAAEALFNNRSPREIRDFTKRWHALSDQHPIPISSGTTWDSLLPRPLPLPNGYVVKDLNSCQRLQDVGRAMNNCLADGVHATQCFFGRARILAIFRNDIPVIALTLENRAEGWTLTAYEGPNYTQPEQGPQAPLTHFKGMLAAQEIELNDVTKRSVNELQEYHLLVPSELTVRTRSYLDTNYTNFIFKKSELISEALRAPGINAAAFYRRWVLLDDPNSARQIPLLRDAAVASYEKSIKEMAEALSLFLQYSRRLSEGDSNSGEDGEPFPSQLHSPS